MRLARGLGAGSAGEDGGDGLNERAGTFDGLGGFRRRCAGLGLRSVIGYGFQFVGIAEKSGKIPTDGRILVREKAECRPKTAMCFGNPTRALEQYGVCGVKCSKICFAPGDLRQAESGIRDGMVEMSSCSPEEACCLRRHRSIPSRRTSPIKAERSV